MSPARLDNFQAYNGFGGVGRWIWSLIFRWHTISQDANQTGTFDRAGHVSLAHAAGNTVPGCGTERKFVRLYQVGFDTRKPAEIDAAILLRRGRWPLTLIAG